MDYATQGVSAVAGEDYIETSGTATFLPGTKKQTISVTVKGDKTIESNETFRVNLSNAVNANIAKATATGTIVNDDGATIASVISNVKTAGIHAVKISPTPANSILRIELSGYTGNVTLQLISMQGRTLLQKKIQAITNFTAAQINVRDLPSGAYLLVAVDETGKRETEKVVVAH